MLLNLMHDLCVYGVCRYRCVCVHYRPGMGITTIMVVKEHYLWLKVWPVELSNGL